MENQKKSNLSKGAIIAIVAGVLAVVFAVLCATHVICLKHDFTPATCTEPATCTKCGRTQGEPAGHTPETDPAVAPTCTETGLTEGSHCAVCGEVLTAQEVVEAAGHTPETDPASVPTCVDSALTEGSHCAVCGGVLVPQEVVEALGHVFSEPTYFEPGICAVCGEAGPDALGNSLFTKLFKGASVERTLTAEKEPASGSMKIKINVTGEGMEDVASVFEGSELTVRFDEANKAIAFDCLLNNGTPFSAVFTLDDNGTIRFAVPPVDENVYKLGLDTLLKILESATEATAGNQEIPMDADLAGEVLTALTEVVKKLAPHLKEITGIVNADTVTDVTGEYTLTALGETVSCRVLTCKPAAEDWKKIIGTVIGSISGDAELKECILTLAKPFAEAGLIPDIAEFYDTAMFMLPLLSGQVADVLTGAELSLAYEGDRVYALRGAYNGTGFGFECAGTLETGLRGVIALYTDAEAHVFGRFDAAATDNELKGSFVSEEIGLTGDLTCAAGAPDCFDVTLNAALGAYKFALTENIAESFMTARVIVETPEFNEDVVSETTLGPVEIALPASSEVEITDADTLKAVLSNLGDGLYNAECLGHDWQNADCDTPKTCRICGATEGEALGHTPGEWTVTREATASATGEESLLCSVCGAALETRSLAATFKFSNADALTGSWAADIPATGMNEGLITNLTGEEPDPELLATLPGLSFRLVLSLNEDGTFVFTPDREQFAAAMRGYLEAVMPTAMGVVFEDTLGVSLEELFTLFGVSDLDGLFKAAEVDIDAIIEESLSEEALEQQLADSTAAGTYAVTDDAIEFIVEDVTITEPYVLVGNALTMTGSSSGISFIASDPADYPIVFTKVA